MAFAFLGRLAVAEGTAQSTTWLFTSFRGNGELRTLAPDFDRQAPPPVLPGVNADPHIALFGDTFYLYWGQGRCKAVKLNDDMISFNMADVRDLTPPGYNEGLFVHKRSGKYYLSWSEYDTRDPRYSVAYGMGDSPLGPFTKASVNPILRQSGPVKGAGHHSIVQIPERDQWVIAYHRFRIPEGNGYNRETCLSPLRHAEDGSILPVDVFETAHLGGSSSVAPQSPAPAPVTTVSLDMNQPGQAISPDLIGIFFEDLSYAADGGLYAELRATHSRIDPTVCAPTSRGRLRT